MTFVALSATEVMILPKEYLIIVMAVMIFLIIDFILFLRKQEEMRKLFARSLGEVEKKKKGGGKKFMWSRMPRLMKWFLYAALVFFVWHVVLNTDNIAHFVTNSFPAHATHTK